MAYYGMMRISELVGAGSNHAVKASNVSMAKKKIKILLVLYSSKTHGKGDPPQKIWIEGLSDGKDYSAERFFCPFAIINDYLNVRGRGFENPDEPLIIFRDVTQPQAELVRMMMRNILKDLHLNGELYDTQSFRIGRTSDLVLKFHIHLDIVKAKGRW